jgi:hypothetical protein
LELDRVVSLEKHVPHGVFPGIWESASYFALCFALEECMWYGCHDARSVTISTICPSRPTMSHGTEELAGIRDNLMGSFSFDMADKANTAGIPLVLVLIEALVGWKRACERLRITLYGVIRGDIFRTCIVGDERVVFNVGVVRVTGHVMIGFILEDMKGERSLTRFVVSVQSGEAKEGSTFFQRLGTK